MSAQEIETKQGITPIYREENLKRTLEFLYEVRSLRFMGRSWCRFLEGNFANVAEHEFSVLWTSMTLAKMEECRDSSIKIDYELMLEMVIVHDIPESRCMDVDYMSRQYVDRDENKAFFDMTENVIFMERLLKAYELYKKRECIEAKIVKDADNLDVELECREQRFTGNQFVETQEEYRQQHVFPNLFTESARTLWYMIRKSNPFDWHILSPNNRFNAGWNQKQ